MFVFRPGGNGILDGAMGSSRLMVLPGFSLAVSSMGVVQRSMPSYLCFVFFVFSSSSLPPPPHLPCSLLLPQVPSAPRRFRVRQPNLETINLEWDHPEHPNGIMTGYTLKYVACTFCPSLSLR